MNKKPKHVKYGGSTAARTIGCPAWLKLSEDLPKNLPGSNPSADEGNMLHDCMERLYGPEYPDLDPEDLMAEGIHYNDEHLTEELIIDKLLPAINAVEDLFDAIGVEDWMVEPYVEIDKDIGGSIDLLAVSADLKTVLILDYKFGYHGVEAKANKQLLFYALAASVDPNTRDLFDAADRIVFAIVQPNGDGDDVDRWDATMEDLDNFETEYLAAVDNSKDPTLEPTPGSWCKYCPVHATCPAKTGQALKAARVNEIVAAKLAEYLPLAEQVTEWAKEVQKLAYEQLELGVPIAGYKLVVKRASRYWNDEKAVTTKIKNAKKIKIADGFDLKLKSPAQLEKVCAKLGVDFSQYTPYISSVSSGSTLAKQSDQRQALLPVQGLAQLNAMYE